LIGPELEEEVSVVWGMVTSTSDGELKKPTKRAPLSMCGFHLNQLPRPARIGDGADPSYLRTMRTARGSMHRLRQYRHEGQAM
jgi:hypothetical protein